MNIINGDEDNILINNYVSIGRKSFTLWLQFIFSLVFPSIICKNLHMIFKYHYRICLLSLILLIGLIFILNLGYLMIYEYLTNMKHTIRINNAIHHLINRTILHGIIIFMALTSMISILGLVLKVSGLTLLISLMVLSFFVFLLSDITFNEFIYGRNTYIFSKLDSHPQTLFSKSSKIIFNVTKDKVPSNPQIEIIYPHMKTRIMDVYTNIMLLTKILTNDNDIIKHIKPELDSLLMLLKLLIKKDRKITSYDFGDIKLRWFRLNGTLNHEEINDSKKLNKIHKINILLILNRMLYANNGILFFSYLMKEFMI